MSLGSAAIAWLPIAGIEAPVTTKPGKKPPKKRSITSLADRSSEPEAR